MVLLSAAVLTKPGKVLVARQFVPMSKIRIDALLADFPKLLNSDSQYTFTETENVRYLFHPLDQLYIVMITNKQSNIIEDLDTLRLLTKLVPEYCEGHTAEAVSTHAFELIFAFDEAVSLGHKENVTVQQIKTFTEMDSHEERLQKIIQESKMNDAREESRRKSVMIEKQKEAAKKQAQAMKGYGGGTGGMGMGMGGSAKSFGLEDQSEAHGAADPYKAPVQKEEKKVVKPAATSSVNKSKGMSLGGKKPKDDFFAQMSKEENLVVGVVTGGGLQTAQQQQQQQQQQGGSKSNIQITIEEILSVALDRDGGVKKVEVKGEMKVCVLDPDVARLVVNTNQVLDKSLKSRLHPKINKKLYADSAKLGLQEANKPFPIGSDNAPIILKWGLKTTEESCVPFSLNFWPNAEDGRSVVSVEFQLEKEGFTFTNITVHIPCPSSEPPEVKTCDGEFRFDPRGKQLLWSIQEISPEHGNGSLEFSVPELDADLFYPINISLSSPQCYAGLEVVDVVHADSPDSHLDYTCSMLLKTDSFTIE